MTDVFAFCPICKMPKTMATLSLMSVKNSEGKNILLILCECGTCHRMLEQIVNSEVLAGKFVQDEVLKK